VLWVQVLSPSGTPLRTIASYSNLDAAAGYVRHSLSLGDYIGQTVTLRFTSVEDSSRPTSFVIDDTALDVS
jgi:zinc metalloprotease ZmpA